MYKKLLKTPKKAAIAILLSFNLAACSGIPTKENFENTDLFKNQADIMQRSEQLHLGLEKKEVFRILGIDPEDLSRISKSEIQNALYGESILTGNKDDLERARDFFKDIEGYKIKYTELKSRASLSFSRIHTTTKGTDMSLTIIFKSGVLLEPPMITGGNIDNKRSKNIIYIFQNAKKAAAELK